MEKPNLKLIKESLPLASERIVKETVTHLVEYIEYLEEQLTIEQNWNTFEIEKLTHKQLKKLEDGT